jgi:hypothetical protein
MTNERRQSPVVLSGEVGLRSGATQLRPVGLDACCSVRAALR